MSQLEFYVAADYARREEAIAVAELISRPGLRLRAKWLTDPPLFEDIGLGGEMPSELDEAAAGVATLDLGEVATCDLLVQLTTGERARGGRHVELGVALAKLTASEPQRQVVVVGPREHVFHYHPGVTVLPDTNALADWAEWYVASWLP